jgi:hypothetical protein
MRRIDKEVISFLRKWLVKPFAIDPFGNRIYMPRRYKTRRHPEQIRTILLAIAPTHCRHDQSVDWWADNVFLTNLSSLSDFCLEEKDLERVSTAAGFAVDERMPLWKVAERMAK